MPSQKLTFDLYGIFYHKANRNNQLNEIYIRKVILF